ncbi:MAG: outer membrane beta-barrel protein [Vicinamibacterales bacterium]
MHIRRTLNSYAFGLRYSALGIVCAAGVLTASPASADATLFIGSTMTPEPRLARGGAVGISLLVVGFEFEYSKTSEDLESLAPSLITGMGNLLVQTPFGTVQPYGTIGGGFYRERLGEVSETNVGINVGGGVKISLAGPLRLRVDYRLFTLQGGPRHSKPQRIYAGLNLTF